MGKLMKRKTKSLLCLALSLCLLLCAAPLQAAAVSQEDIDALFSMTPYYYRTGREQQERLAGLGQLTTTADFELLVYRKF